MRDLELVFDDGTAQLLTRGTEKIIWSSDDDDDFRDTENAELLTADDHAEEVLQYLYETDVISKSEAENLEVVEEIDDGEDTSESVDEHTFEGEIEN